MPAGSAITAVDREKQWLEIEGVNFIRANFEKDQLQLEELDGILIANALHYVWDKVSLITRLSLNLELVRLRTAFSSTRVDTTFIAHSLNIYNRL